MERTNAEIQATWQVIKAPDSQGRIEVLVPNVHTNHFHSGKVTCPGYPVKVQTGYFDDEIP